MIGKDWEIIEFYKNMLIYKKNGVIHFGNKSYTNVKANTVKGAKNRITRYINQLNENEQKKLCSKKYSI